MDNNHKSKNTAISPFPLVAGEYPPPGYPPVGNKGYINRSRGLLYRAIQNVPSILIQCQDGGEQGNEGLRKKEGLKEAGGDEPK